ncbi:MOSC domain-containing protein [Deinococcus roseus]|uniref:Molybdenum cofactor biosysynthesis protein n=1 Tax=Deinococcus roseus TaxID=392414 RepID=A0ABQ2D5I3_9DEIO|nr:MOSC domain-containing protein [Deinococcus roseus]GGJ46702.1 molybdenum cofactor biosysynthesis protein [Deinococcus roseus]
MQLIGVDLGQAELIEGAGKSGLTGIFKRPVLTPVHVGALGLTGDTICDTRNHGGPDQAVYVYGMLDYQWWENELGVPLLPGTFGENLTLSHLASSNLLIGDRFEIGSVVLEVTSPRIPCSTLAARMGDPTFVKRFRAAERPGAYCRVLQEGTLQAGDPVTHRVYPGEPVRLNQLFEDFFEPPRDLQRIRRHLAAPVHHEVRQDREKQQARLLAGH